MHNGLVSVSSYPASQIPKRTAANSGMFGNTMATTSPLLKPLLIKAAANPWASR